VSKYFVLIKIGYLTGIVNKLIIRLFNGFLLSLKFRNTTHHDKIHTATNHQF